MAETNADKVRRYTECLQNGVDTKRSLKRLYHLEVTLDAYTATDTYRIVKRFETMPEYAKYARRVKEKIQKMDHTRKRDHSDDGSGGSASELKKPKREPDTDELFAMAMGGTARGQVSNSAPRPARDYSKYKVTKRTEVKVEPKSEPVDDYETQPCSSSSSSNQHSQESVRKPQKEYAPSLPPSLLKPPQHHKPHIPQSASLRVDESQFKPRKERQKVFAGRKRKLGDEVPTLILLCQNVLASNVSCIDHVGIIPYTLMKPVLQNATIDQLRHILDANPFLADDADELFHERVVHEFPKYKDREMDGTMSWREMYDKLLTRKEKKETAKLEMLTSRIGKAHSASDQGRRTMVIDMAHTRVKSKSFFTSARDTQVKMLNTPSAIQLSQARKHVKTEGKAQLATITPRGGGAGPSSSSRSGGGGGSKPTAPKTAPLMAKCRKMMKR